MADKFGYITSFYTLPAPSTHHIIHDPDNGYHNEGYVKATHRAQSNLQQLPSGVWVNPYTGGRSPSQLLELTIKGLIQTQSPSGSQTAFDTLLDTVGYEALVIKSNAIGTQTLRALALVYEVTPVVPEREIKNQVVYTITFHIMSQQWTVGGQTYQLPT